MSRGLRNCNPGNIRQSRSKFQGEVRPSRDSAFKQFETMAYGYRAMFVLLDTYHRRYGLTTIREMFFNDTATTEIFTEGYIRFVAERTGISADAQVDSRSERDMVPIVAAMSEIENGAKAVMADLHEGWALFVR